MKEEWPIIRQNLLIFGALVLLLLLGDATNGFQQMIVTAMGLLIIPTAMGIVLLIIGLVYFYRDRKMQGRAYLLSALLIPIIGTSLCFGGGALLGMFP